MRLATLQTMLVISSMLALTACGTSGPASVVGLKRVVGVDLIGARGATPVDQRKINRTVVGICGAKVWTEEQCARHGELVSSE